MGNRKLSLLIRAGFGLTAVNVLVGLLGYAYQILMGRMLEPSEFALFGALIGLFMFFSAPLSAMSLLVARQVSSLKLYDDSFALLRRLFLNLHKFLSISGVVFIVLFYLSLDWLQEFLKTDAYAPLWVFTAAIVASAFFAICNAFYQGLQKFNVLGATSITFATIKIAAGYILVFVGFGASGALSGILISSLLLWIIAIPVMVGFLGETDGSFNGPPSAFPWATIFPILIANVAFAAMTQLDMVFVKHLFSPEEASVYFAASILGKAILYLPAGIVMALFPLVAENDVRGQSSAHMLIQAVTITVLMCLFVAVIYWLFSDWIVYQLYGPKYQGAAELLKWYGFAVLPMALVMVAEYFLIAKGRVLFAWLFLAVAPIQICAIYLWHDQLWMIVAIIAAFGALLSVLGYVQLWKEYRTT